MPYRVVLWLGEAQVWLARRYESTGNFAWAVLWGIVRPTFKAAGWVRYGPRWWEGV